MTDTPSEDELVEKVGVSISDGEMLECPEGSCEDCDSWRELARKAISTARPIIAQQEREKVLRELHKYARSKSDVIFTPRSFLGCFESEHGITLED